jgi:predicted flap endonuclease-1-like 5' DNA nuclease
MGVPLNELRGATGTVLAGFKKQGVNTSDSLLGKARTPQDRDALATAVGVDGTLLLALVKRADIARLKGIGRVYSDMLEESGATTISELAQCLPETLHATLRRINAKRRLTNRPPSLDQVTDFIDQARTLPLLIRY